MPSKQEVDAILSEPVCIIGAGPAGLITAHTLLQDGFKNVQIFTKDEGVGGVWSKKRVYPGLVINKYVQWLRLCSLLGLYSHLDCH